MELGFLAMVLGRLISAGGHLFILDSDSVAFQCTLSLIKSKVLARALADAFHMEHSHSCTIHAYGANHTQRVEVWIEEDAKGHRKTNEKYLVK
eukprot:1262506-Amphidinium_carterae.1